MRALKWWGGAPGEWHAWALTGGGFAEALFTIARTFRGLRVSARSHTTHEEVAIVDLPHQAYTLADAQRAAEQLRTWPLPLATPAVEDRARIEAHLQALTTRRRCRFVHGFPAEATDVTSCQCGRVSYGHAKAHGLARAS